MLEALFRQSTNLQKKTNPKVKKILAKNVTGVRYKKNMSMSINKLKKILKNNKSLLKIS